MVESNETFTVGLTVSGTSLSITATDTGTGTVNNDDGAVVTVNNSNASEGDDITFTVTLGAAVQGGLTVTPDFTDVTAVEGTDYTENTTALSFSGTKGETKTFTVSTTEDAVLEANETFTVGLSSSNSSVTATDTGTGTINNDDSAAVTVNDANADEGDSMTFTVTLSEAVQGGLTVTPGYTNGTAASTDYDENTTALTFTGTKGETETFTVSTTEDAVLEANETFRVSLSVSNAPSGVTATDTGAGTINNDDSATVTINDASADEGEGITFTVTLGQAVQGGLTVTPSFTDGTAIEGTDYTENTTALTFTGNANETKTFTVSTTEDAVLEANETFTVGLTVSGTSLSIAATDTGTGTINNDDSAAVTINDASATEGESMTFTVTLSQAVQGGLTVTPSFTDGTATKGTDYTENTAVLSFTGTANETKTFTVSTTADGVFEHTETFTVGLSVSNARSEVGSSDTGTGSIYQTSKFNNPAVTINDASANEGDSMTFTVTLDSAVQDGLTVTPSFTDGTATKGTDYTENTTALTFNGTAGETKTFTVSTTEDGAVESNETFTISLTASFSGVTDTDTGTGTINNNDVRPAVALSGPSDTQAGAFDVTITFSTSVTGFEQSDIVVGNGTATAFSGSADSYAATITPTASGTVTVDVPENVARDQAVNGNTAADQFSVQADLDAPTVVISGPSDTQTGAFDITITFSESVTGFVQSDISVTNGTATTFSGSGANYTATITPVTTGTVTIDVPENVAADAAGNGNTAADPFSVQIVAPTVTTPPDEDPTSSVQDSTSTTEGNAIVSQDSTSTTEGSAIKGNAPDSATVTINDASAVEGNDIIFTITLDNAIAGGFTLTPNFTDKTAQTGTDYTPNTAPLTFTGTKGETQTFAVATIGDGAVESHETFTVGMSVSNTSQTAHVTATDTGTGTINDNDVYPTVTINGPSDVQTGAFDITITFSESVVRFVQRDIAVGNGSVTAFSGSGASYTATITPAASGTVTVDVPKNVAQDYAGNGNRAAVQFTVQADIDRPSVVITGPSEVQSGAFDVTITFSESVTGFMQSDIAVGNGSVTAFSGSGTNYTATITPVKNGTVTVDVPENVAHDDAGNGNTAAEQFSVVIKLPTPNITVIGASGLELTTAENGTTDQFKVRLDRVPTANIILAINSSDLTEGAVTPGAITFTNENWNIPQTVTITGQDDAIDDGDQDYHIVLTPTSDDYDDLDALNLDVTNRDDDTAGITITSISGLVRQPQGVVSLKRAVGTVLGPTSQLITSEAGHTVSFAVVLDSEPTAPVTLAIKCSDLTEGALSTKSLTFIHYNPNLPVTDGDNEKTTAHWNTPQMVTVTGLPDNLNDGMQPYIVTVSPVSGADPIYNALGPKQVSLVNLDDVALIDLTLSQGTLTPTFDSQTPHYTATVGNAVESLTATPTASDTAATITVNGAVVQSGTPSGAIALGIGANTIEIIVTSTIYTVVSTKTYTVTVTREENNAPDAPVLQDQTTMVGEAFHYAFAEVNDPDPDQTITYTATLQGGGTLPGWLRFDAANRAFSGTPARADVGSVSIAVTATDNGIPPMAASATFTLTVEPPDVNPRAFKLALASFGRTVASNAVDVLESRFTSPRADGVMLGGQSLTSGNNGNRIFGLLYGIAQSAGLSINIPTSPDALNAAGNMAAPGMLGSLPNADTPLFDPIRFHRRSVRDILSQSSFDMRLGRDDAGKPSPWALWGQGNASGFSGSEDNISLNGRVFSAFLGVDHHLKNNTTLGLALSHSTGEIDYNAPDGDAGTIDLSLNSLIPYAHYAADKGFDVWGMGSAGWGNATVTDAFNEAQTDISMVMGALGMQNPVAQVEDIALSVKGDVFVVGIGSDVREKLPLTEADVQRVRFALQGETDHQMSETPC